MPFIESAKNFRNQKINDKEQAQKLMQQFAEEQFTVHDFNAALLHLKALSVDFSLSLNSRMILEKVRKTFSQNDYQLQDLTRTLYALTECGFSAQHFSQDLKNFFISELFKKIDERTSRYSGYSYPQQIRIIAGFTALKNLGLLENASAELKTEIAERLKKLAASQVLRNLPDTTKNALKDFSAYCKIVLGITNPDFSRLPSTAQKNSPTSIEYKIFSAFRKFLGEGDPENPLDEFGWNHGKGYKMPVVEGREELSYRVGNCSVSFECSILDDRHATDMMLIYRQGNSEKYLAVEADGDRFHKALIDEKYVTNGKTLARNKILELVSNQPPLVIEQKDFWCFDGNLRVAIDFFSTFEQLRQLREMNRNLDEALPDNDVQTEKALNAEIIAEPQQDIPREEDDEDEVEEKTPEKKKKKKKTSPQKDSILQMLRNKAELEDIEDVIKRQNRKFEITSDIVRQVILDDNLEALILFRRYGWGNGAKC